MRAIVWFTLLFTVAVVAATTLGGNDALVSFYWSGWRTDISLNLFLLALAVTCFALVTMIQAVSALVGLPRRSREWRSARRDRIAQAALREALAQYFGGRYSRARKAAQRALAVQADAAELAADAEFAALGHLLIAGSAHRLQDRPQRDAQLREVHDLARRSAAARAAEEGARLLAAEWALDDRDAPRALELLAELPPGVARRTHALRLRLQAERLAHRPQEALRTARLLAHHQGFSAPAALGLIRSLALELLDASRDLDQLRRLWQQLDPADRRDPFIAARAAGLAARFGSTDDGRQWLRPSWDRLPEFDEDERRALAQALIACLPGIAADWLPRLEAAQQALPRDGAVACAVGCSLAERRLWGRALVSLRQAAVDEALPAVLRCHAWRVMASLADEQGDAAEAARCQAAVAALG